MLKGELLCHRLRNHVDVTGHFCEGSNDRSDDPSGLAVGTELRIEAAPRVACPGIE